MHGMLSLAVLVAAFVGLAGSAGYLAVRLYLACPAGQAQPPTDTADQADTAGKADEHASDAAPVA